MVDLENIERLLNEVVALNNEYKEANLNSDYFNIFEILKLARNEVRTHSAFLSELLNPRGTHGLGDEFLKLFIKELNIKDFDTKDVYVKKEKFLGWISENYEEGGYIDIFITNKDHAIIIENKIDAGDQESQLKRYHNYGEKRFKDNFTLIYWSQI